MPMANFHAARVRSPGDFLKAPWATITLKGTKGVELVTGKLKADGPDGPMTAQSYRFDKSIWTPEKAKAWLKSHKVKAMGFEPARKGVVEVTMANMIAQKFERCFAGAVNRRKKKAGLEVSEAGEVVATGSNLTNDELRGSFEFRKDQIRKALTDKNEALYGKYPWLIATYEDHVFIQGEGGRYYKIPYTMKDDEITMGAGSEIEKVTKYVIKEMIDSLASEVMQEMPMFEAVWTTAFINDLPDSSFAYISPGGKKDSGGKTTPRGLRHLPYKDGSGKVDKAHVRNALARLPQTNIPPAAKKSALAKLRAAAKGSGVEVSEQGEEVHEGGPGSGNFGHKGRPGKRGGSLPGGSRGGGEKAKGKRIIKAKKVPRPLKKKVSKGTIQLIKTAIGKSLYRSGKLDLARYKKLKPSQKEAVLEYGLKMFREKYIPANKQKALTAKQKKENKVVGALEGMRRAKIKQALTYPKTSKERRVLEHMAVSMQHMIQQHALAIRPHLAKMKAGIRRAEAGVKQSVARMGGGAG